MTQLFENLPEARQGAMTDRQIDHWFEKRFWPFVPPRGTPPKKVEKRGARFEYRKAVKRGATPEQLEQAVKMWACEAVGEDPQYIPSARKWLLHGRYEDEVVPVNRVDDVEHSWMLRAANIRAGGTESAAVVKGCFERGYITKDEMERAL